MCFIFHDWSKWEIYFRPMKEGYHWGAFKGKIFDTVEERQKRTCKKCGITQDIIIK